MSLNVPTHERGVVRVFALSMTDAEAKALKTAPERLPETLGVSGLLNTDHIELFAVSDLEDIGLAGYLTEGAGVPAAQLAPDRIKLEKLSGWVMVVFSLAFEDRATTLRPIPALTLIATYGEVRTDWSSDAEVASEAAKPFTAPPETTKKRPSDAAMSGRVATLVLIVLAIFTYVFIRIAG